MPNAEMCFALMLTAMRDQMMLDLIEKKGLVVSEAYATASVIHKLRDYPDVLIAKAADMIDAYDERQMPPLVDMLRQIGFTVIVLE